MQFSVTLNNNYSLQYEYIFKRVKMPFKTIKKKIIYK